MDPVPKMAMRSLLRVHKEIEDVNGDFHSLRTVLKETANKNKWDFVMFPNDGALSHLPLIGEIIIPEKYPEMPPVLHLFTRTLRYNVDVYHGMKGDENHSTMCFDILSSEKNGGTWKQDYTISCLFASLMQALVTQRVPQTYGGDKPEFVSMGKLEQLKHSVHQTYMSHKDRFPLLPVIPMIPATSIPAEPFIFTKPDDEAPLDTLQFQADDKYVSQAIYLQDSQNPGSWSTTLDLRNLHPGVVFSVILSNKRGVDPSGHKNDTILLRNGVTGTAAKKRKGQPISWFYHGKPLNDRNLSVCITVTNDQFVFAYKDDDTNTFIVHGDTPISKLGEAQIGNVSGIPFYLTILLKRKNGEEGFINVLEQNRTGYIHKSQASLLQRPQSQIPVSDKLDKTSSIKLNFFGNQMARLQALIDFYELGMDFKVRKSILSPAESILIDSGDYAEDEFRRLTEELHAKVGKKIVKVNITSIIADQNCVAFLADGGEETESLTEKKILPFLMRTRDNTVAASCVNELVKRVTEENQKDWVHVGDVLIELPQPVKMACQLQFQF